MNIIIARKKYRYIKSTGQIILQESQRSDLVGKPMGSLNKDGYIYVNIAGKITLAHRFAWFLVTGSWPTELDHKNTLKNDNRWDNLREATRTENCANAKTSKNNELGVKGVHLRKTSGRYRARVCRNGKSISLGDFNTPEEAHAAYAAAAKKHFGEFARLR